MVIPLLASLLISVSLGISQSTAPAPPTCKAPEHRQFDFWVGDWDVTDPEGQLVGHNTITRMLDDCVVHEQWRGGDGETGESFNIWDRTTKRWHQTWVSSTGALLLLDGGLVDGAMRMTGETTSPRGRVLHRITWTPGPAGSFRQFWEASSDGGKTWSVAFDGRYKKAEGGGAPAARASGGGAAATEADG